MSKEEAKIVANDDSGISCEDGCDFSMGEYCRVCGEGLTWEQPMSKEEGMTMEQFLKEQHDKLVVGGTLEIHGVTFTVIDEDDPKATPPKNARY